MRHTPSAADSARWLAEVAQALDEAQLLVQRIPQNGSEPSQRIELLQRIESAKRATLSLRLASERRFTRPSSPERT